MRPAREVLRGRSGRSAASGRWPPRRDGGTVTAEVAIVLPVVVAVLVAVVVTGGAAVTQVRCADAARVAARAAALGTDLTDVREMARAVLPDASITVGQEGGWVVARVERRVATLGWMVGPVVASAEARSRVEPGAAAGAVRSRGSRVGAAAGRGS